MSKTIQIRGIDEVLAKMDQLGRNLKRRSGRRVIRDAFWPMRGMAERTSPARSGAKMRNSWDVKTYFDEKGQPTGYLFNKMFYALYIERGHKIVRISRSGTLKRGRYTGGRTRSVRGFVNGKNVLRNAFEATGDQVIDRLAAEMKKSLDGALLQAGGRK